MDKRVFKLAKKFKVTREQAAALIAAGLDNPVKVRKASKAQLKKVDAELAARLRK